MTVADRGREALDVCARTVAATSRIAAGIATVRCSGLLAGVLIIGMIRFSETKHDRVEARGHKTPMNYHDLVAPLIAPDRRAFRTSSMVFRFAGAIPPHSNRVAAGVQ